MAGEWYLKPDGKVDYAAATERIRDLRRRSTHLAALAQQAATAINAAFPGKAATSPRVPLS
jgi:hypothetical protein